MDNRRIMSALVGLAGAYYNNGKSESTDAVVRAAILADDSDEAVAAIRNEKYTISPGCAACQSPCGNTSDYDLSRESDLTESQIELKKEIVSELRRIVQVSPNVLPDIVYKAIAYYGYDLAEESYKELLEEMKNG